MGTRVREEERQEDGGKGRVGKSMREEKDREKERGARGKRKRDTER